MKKESIVYRNKVIKVVLLLIKYPHLMLDWKNETASYLFTGFVIYCAVVPRLFVSYLPIPGNQNIQTTIRTAVSRLKITLGSF